MIELSAGDYRLQLSPERGGSILRLDWRDKPLLRPVCGPGILDTACFPLVPFSNRIAHGQFRLGAVDVSLSPNFPGSDHPHPLHGFGWLAQWEVIDAGQSRVVIRHDWPGGEWPWPYRAEQVFSISPEGLSVELSVTNLGSTAMFAGLGFHPYFPRDADTVYHGLHRGEWKTGEDCLPLALDEAPVARDWWAGQPVGTRSVDTVYSGRVSPLAIEWPSRGHAITLSPSDNLPDTVVFTPCGETFFCVEPVNHRTDLINAAPEARRALLLEAGQTCTVTMQLSAFEI